MVQVLFYHFLKLKETNKSFLLGWTEQEETTSWPRFPLHVNLPISWTEVEFVWRTTADHFLFFVESSRMFLSSIGSLFLVQMTVSTERWLNVQFSTTVTRQGCFVRFLSPGVMLHWNVPPAKCKLHSTKSVLNKRKDNNKNRFEKSLLKNYQT